MTQREIFVVGAARTAIGTYGGTLKDTPMTQLATTAVKGALERSGPTPDRVGHVVMGNVIPTEARGAYLSRAAATDAWIPEDRLCGSAAQAIVSAAQTILLGDADPAIGGGAAPETMCIGGGQGIAAIFERA